VPLRRVRARRRAVAGPTAAAVAPTAEIAKIERQGNQRWLVVNMPPEKAWPILLEFWPSVGLAVEKSDPATGVMETVWAENKAKLPQDMIRKTLGRFLGSLYETGEQDKYRARLERTTKDTSEIFISHRAMIEVFTSSQQDRTAWQPKAADPEMEAEMLQRLLVRFDSTAAKSVSAAATAGRPGASVVDGSAAGVAAGTAAASAPVEGRSSSRVPMAAASSWISTIRSTAPGDGSGWRSIAAASRSRIVIVPKAPTLSATWTPITRPGRRSNRAFSPRFSARKSRCRRRSIGCS
jgi:hypothetical protein